MSDWTSLVSARARVAHSSREKGGNCRMVSRLDQASLVQGYTEANTSIAR